MKNKHVIKLVLLAICSMTLFSSCSYYTSTIKAEKALGDIAVGVVSQLSIQKKENTDLLKNAMGEGLNAFFSNYYTIEDVILLEANKVPKTIDSNYTNYYDNYYIAVLKSLSNYISEDLKQKISSGYYVSVVDLPRFVNINDYTIIDYKDITNIAFNVLKNTDDKYQLQVNVDVNAEVVKTGLFETKYSYVLSEGYYKDLGTQFVVDDIDQYKIKATYYVDCTMLDGKLLVDRIVEKNDLFIDEQRKHKKENNNFIARMPYKNVPTEEEKKPVEEFFNVFFAQDYDSLRYFKDIQNSAFTFVNTYFENKLNTKLIVLLDEETYRDKFPASISPIRDNIVGVEKTGEVSFRPYTDSTLNHQKYYIDIPVTVKYTDESTENIMYIYVVEVNNKSGLYRIEALEYISSKKLSEEKSSVANPEAQASKTTEASSKVEEESQTVNSLKDLGE